MSKEPIKLWEPDDPDIKKSVEGLIYLRPVKNLTNDEAYTTLRLLSIQGQLADPEYDNRVFIDKNDSRLANLSDMDKFLALLVAHTQRNNILCTKDLIYYFGGTKPRWRNIGRTCSITSVASAISECSSGYCGRGWVIAPHIVTLIKWIKDHPMTKELFPELYY